MKRLPIDLALAATLVLAACARTASAPVPGASSSPSEAPSATPLPSMSPAILPASSVRVVVNGVERAYGSMIAVDGVGGTTVSLTFPFPVDRPSVDRWLPRNGSPAWIDDRTVNLVFAETEPYPGFKVPQIKSIDGLRTIDLLIVALRYLPSVTVSVYSIADATSSSGAKASGSWRVAGGNRFAISPDVTRILLYPERQPPHVVELATRSSVDLTAPADAYVFGSGWLPDGRVVLVGGAELWSGQPSGPLTRIADLKSVHALAATPSPRGTFVGIVGTDAVWVADLRDGAVRAVAGSTGGCGNGLAWSKDESLLAWMDCANLSVRVTDVAKNRIVRTIDGVATGLTGLPTGDLIVSRDSGENGEGARRLGVVYSFTGTEKARYLGYAWSLSADGRYLLNIGSCCAGGPSSSLVDLRAPDPKPISLPGIASWTADGRIIVTSFSSG